MLREKKQVKDTVKKLTNKGQALVEFVILLPIILFIIFVIIDFATIFYNKNHLEGVINTVATMASDHASDNEILKVIDDKDINYSITYESKYATITLSKDVSLVTPFSNFVLKNPYPIKVERVIIYEQ